MVMQRVTHPAVYLDTWALRLFAEERPDLGARLRKAIVNADGTLAISRLSVNEFSRFDDVRYADAVGRFIDTIFPRLFFLQSNPFEVINAELALLVGQRNGTPAGDVAVLNQFADDAERTGRPSVQPWFLSAFAERAQVRVALDQMAQTFILGFEDLREQFRTQPEMNRIAIQNIKRSTIPRATQALLRSLLYRLQGNRTFRLEVNDALDVAHALVATAYADFVLLDYRWCFHLADAAKFMRRYKIHTPVAELYSRRDDGIERVLQRLEAWR
jgi:hypothetical protein